MKRSLTALTTAVAAFLAGAVAFAADGAATGAPGWAGTVALILSVAAALVAVIVYWLELEV